MPDTTTDIHDTVVVSDSSNDEASFGNASLDETQEQPVRTSAHVSSAMQVSDGIRTQVGNTLGSSELKHSQDPIESTPDSYLYNNRSAFIFIVLALSACGGVIGYVERKKIRKALQLIGILKKKKENTLDNEEQAFNLMYPIADEQPAMVSVH